MKKRITQADKLMLKTLQTELLDSKLHENFTQFREQNFKFAVETQSDVSIPDKQRKSQQMLRNREAMLNLKRAVDRFLSAFASVTDAQQMSLERLEQQELLERRYWLNLLIADPENKADSEALNETQRRLDFVKSGSLVRHPNWKKRFRIPALR